MIEKKHHQTYLNDQILKEEKNISDLSKILKLKKEEFKTLDEEYD